MQPSADRVERMIRERFDRSATGAADVSPLALVLDHEHGRAAVDWEQSANLTVFLERAESRINRTVVGPKPSGELRACEGGSGFEQLSEHDAPLDRPNHRRDRGR
jgi:hypothetical protein